ncbi:MAG: tetratricopeptide repeat protein [Hyphomicrobiales bacterium]|nr:tetratricopeptide repeat protein [Hyphomicrobiales bacterium]
MNTNSTIKAVCLITLVILTGCQSSSSDTKADLESKLAKELKEGLPAGKHHFKAGNYGLSERNYRLALEVDPTNAEAWLGLGATYDQLGRYDLADRSYKQVMKIAGPVPQLMNNIGYSYMLRGKKRKAKTYFAKAQKGLPENLTINGNRELLAKL